MLKNTPLNSPFSPVPPSLRPAVAIRDFLRNGKLVKKGETIEVTEREFLQLVISKAVREQTQFDDVKNVVKKTAFSILDSTSKQKNKKGK